MRRLSLILPCCLYTLGCITPASADQSQPKDEILRIDRGLDIDYCQPSVTQKPRNQAKSDEKSVPTHMEADNLELDQDARVIELHGGVRLSRDQTRLEADQARYDQTEEAADLQGSVYLEQPGLRLTAREGRMNLEKHQGWLNEVEFRLPDYKARGSAQRMELLSEQISRYTDAEYTTCPPGSSDWNLHAKEMEIDQGQGWGSAWHTRFELGGVPVFYTPYITFPVDDRRKTGLLIPSWGTSLTLGTELTLPYYLNLAPNYDATLSPRWMSRRGVMLGGEFRYLGENHQGVLAGEILDDRVEAEDRKSRRSLLRLTHRSEFLPGLTTRIDATEVSDQDYLNDFKSGLSNSSARYLERIGEAIYQRGDWRFGTRLQDFQTIDETLAPASRPYSLLPQLTAGYRHLNETYNIDLGLESEYTIFNHETLTTGSRVRIHPSVALPWRRSWGHLIPRLSLHYNTYQLDEIDPTDEASPSLTVPVFSLDSGLVFERESRWFGESAFQTLEPRLFYLRAPFEDQSDLPDFDTADLDLSFASLFRENRFTGGDRIGDANQIAVGLTSRWLQADNGMERLRASIGRIHYFQDRRVQLTDPIDEDNQSPWVAEVGARLGRHWRSSLNLRWDPTLEEEPFDKGRFLLNYKQHEERLFNLGYNYSSDLIEDLDLSFLWRFDHRFSLLGAWKHSIFHKRDLNRMVGLEYGGHCCWSLMAVYQEYVNSTDPRLVGDRETDYRFMLQLQLRGLGALGKNIQEILGEFIQGYQYEP